MDTTPKLTTLSTSLARLLAVLITVAIPTGYYLLGYENQRAVVATEAYMNSIFISQAIGESPEFWRYEEQRLAEILMRHSSREFAEQRSIIDLNGEVIARTGGTVDPPVLTISHQLFDSGNVVGRMEINTSLRPLLVNSAVTAGLSLLFGLAVYVPLRLFRVRAEEELRESRQYLLDIIQFFPDATVVIDREGKVVAWNRAMEELSGVRAEEMLGKGDFEYSLPFYPQRRPLLVDLALRPGEIPEGAYASIDRRGNTLFGEAYIHNARGERLYFHGTAAPLHNTRGELIGAIESIRDITERKTIEAETERHGALVERLNASLIGLAKDERIYGGDMKDAFRAITESSAGALTVGRVSIWFYSDGNSGIDCMDLYDAGTGVHWEGGSLLASAYPVYFSELEKECSIVADDAVNDPRTREFTATYLAPLGITSMLDVPIRVTGRVIGVVCHEHVGKPRTWDVEEQSFATAIAGFTAMALEIHERMAAEERISTMNADLKMLLDSLPSGVIVVDPESHTIVNANTAAVGMIGASRSDIVGRVCHKFVCPADVGTCPVIDGGGIMKSIDQELVNARGESVPIVKSVVAMKFDGHEYLVENFIDITERKRLETERESLIQALQEALARVKVLSGMLPICASCKKIRDDKGYWNQLEIYISEHSDALFSHGICPDCLEKTYAELEALKSEAPGRGHS
jgi:PAS domain S-box-containing protein